MTATYYTRANHSHHLANGESWEHASRGGAWCAAPSRYKMGSKIWVKNLANGKTIVVTVKDRGCSCIDLPSRHFARIAGPRWKIIGRIKIKMRVLP